MTEDELHERAAKLEKQIQKFRILSPDGAVQGGFGRLNLGAAEIGERISNLEKSVDQFHLVGADDVHVAGRFTSGYAVNAKPGLSMSGAGGGGGGGGGGGDVFGCTDPEATNYNPAATVDDGSCTYSDCFALSLFADAPDCDGDFFVGDFTNPLGRDATMTISGSVDDDLLVDGVVIQAGEFPFTDDTDPPCPGSGSLNGEHEISYSTTVSSGQTVSISVRNNFRGTANVSGSVCFS